jgi:hypothetical protein
MSLEDAPERYMMLKEKQSTAYELYLSHKGLSDARVRYSPARRVGHPPAQILNLGKRSL